MTAPEEQRPCRSELPHPQDVGDEVVLTREQYTHLWVGNESWRRWWSDQELLTAVVDREVAARIRQVSYDISAAAAWSQQIPIGYVELARRRGYIRPDGSTEAQGFQHVLADPRSQPQDRGAAA